MLTRLILLLSLFGCTCLLQAQSPSAPAPDTQTGQSAFPGSALQSGQPAQLFTFHNGFWINLHHFLYNQALLNEKATGYKARKLIPSDTVHMEALSPSDRQHWQEAISYYSQNMCKRDLLFDDGMVAIKNALEDQQEAPALNNSGIPSPLEAILNNVAAGYRQLYWKRQDQYNQNWIRQIQLLVGQYGSQLVIELSTLYRMPWPKEPIRVDVTNYASWSGAYTSDHPDRITLSSVDSANQGIAALEVLFHESSHIIIDSITAHITTICKRDNRKLPNDALWHAILFYTTGEVVKRHFPQYLPYAWQNGLWKRAWPMYIDALDKYWRPYIEGKTPFGSALDKLVKALEITAPAPKG